MMKGQAVLIPARALDEPIADARLEIHRKAGLMPEEFYRVV